MRKIVLSIDGMRCSMCESHINDICRKFKSVIKVNSSHTRNETVVIASSELSLDDLIQAISNDGYKVLNSREEPYEKKKIFSFLRK